MSVVADFLVDTMIRRHERFIAMAQAMTPLSEVASRSIEGGIALNFDGHTLLTPEDWDDVDSLWGYLVNGCARANQGQGFECLFPNAPVAIKIEPGSSGRMTIEIGTHGEEFHRKAVVPKEVLNAAVSEGATAFFRWLEAVSPQRFPATWAHIAFLKGEGPPTQTWTLGGG